MKDEARDVLVEAAMRGVKQIRVVFSDGADGRCVMGILAEAAGLDPNMIPSPWYKTAIFWDMDCETRKTCDLCQAKYSEMDMLVHLNDTHRLDFLTIARKV